MSEVEFLKAGNKLNRARMRPLLRLSAKRMLNDDSVSLSNEERAALSLLADDPGPMRKLGRRMASWSKVSEDVMDIALNELPDDPMEGAPTRDWAGFFAAVAKFLKEVIIPIIIEIMKAAA